MNIIISCSVRKAIPEIKTLHIIKPVYHKEHTKLTIWLGRLPIDFQDVVDDINTLGLQGLPLRDVSIIVSNCPALGRIVNRSISPFAQIGLSVSRLRWEAVDGQVDIGSPIIGADLPFIVATFNRLLIRGCAPLGNTQRPFTLFDFQQLIGIVYDSRQGMSDAVEILDWFAVRELTTLEGQRELKRLEKVAAKEAAEQAARERVIEAKKRLADAPVPPTLPDKDDINRVLKWKMGKKKQSGISPPPSSRTQQLMGR